MRTKSVLAGLLTTLMTLAPLGSIPSALAQAAPPSNEPPPNYTPPPPPAGYDTAPSYAAPPGAPPPPPTRGRGRAGAGGTEVRFEPDEPDLQLYSMSGGVPFERIRRYHRGWWGGGYSVGYGWAPEYSPVCDQACATRFSPGPYHLALSKNGGRVVPVYGPAVITGPSLIRGSYSDRSGVRAAGWIIGIGGLVGGIVMIAVSASDDTTCDPGDGFCHHHETVNAPLLVGGIGVLIVTGIVGGVLASQRDEAHISVEPLRLSSYGGLRESLAAMGAETHPQGAALALHF